MSHRVYIFRIGIVFIVLAVICGALTRHLYRLQVVRHPELHAKAVSIYTARKISQGNRGSIFDRNGYPLVGNYECKTVLADLHNMPKDTNTRANIMEHLIRFFRVDVDVLSKRFNSMAHEVVVAKNVDIDIAGQVQKMHLPGIRFIDGERRYYPKGSLLANVLGFSDENNQGVYGLEWVWNQELSPKKLEQVYERDLKGRPISHKSPKSQSPEDGMSLYLTIDEPIQNLVEAELNAMVNEHHPRVAYAIMANPKTGAIMAMAQYPSFNPNERKSMDPAHWQNHMITDVYDPGSTMKCIAIAGALDYSLVNMNTVFNCEKGYWVYAGRGLRDADHKFENLRVSEIIQKSSNIGTAKIALIMGEKRLYQTLRRFGFGTKTDIGLPNESAGIFRPLKQWDGLSITRFPIGQGISVTPLQMVQAYCALANQGEMMQLHLVDRIYNPQTTDFTAAEAKLKQRAIRSDTAKKIIAAMTLVTQEGGTATKAAVEGYLVAGKTGTSQKLVNGSYAGHRKYVSSFIGFVPAYDPAFVLLVIADEPSNGYYYGGTVAAPVFNRIAEQTLRYLNIPKTEKIDEEFQKLVKH